MNVDVPIHDAEVVCNGLPLWQGAQLAVDATLVSPLSRDGTETQPGAAVRTAARRKRRQTYPELDRGRRYRLVWSWDAEAASFLPARASPRPCRACCAPPGCTGSLGAASLLLLRSGRLQPRSSSCRRGPPVVVEQNVL